AENAGPLNRVQISPLSSEESSRAISDTVAHADQNEDNSDIGYHSDISVGKPASVESMTRAATTNTMVVDNSMGYANLGEVVHSNFRTFDPNAFGISTGTEPPTFDAIYLNEPPTASPPPFPSTVFPSIDRGGTRSDIRRFAKQFVAPALPPGRRFGNNFAESSRSFVRMTADKKRRLSSACPAPDDNEEILNIPTADFGCSTSSSNNPRSITSVSLDLPRPCRKISCPQRAVSACFNDEDGAMKKYSISNFNFATSQNGKDSVAEGTLRIYAAYPCGFPKGTCVRLKVNCKTTTKQILRLVIKHFNDSAVKTETHNNGYTTDPILKKCKYTENDAHLFCLVVVIGARERCLRDDYPPLELQNPWSKGKLFVRLKNDILAALEFGNEAKV
uniref:Ras-associating domain-containing protein n=1 Tax=Romanomermis culicivorax TaxID=13658 RepID=A0A915IP49_ROMCU